MKLSFGHITHYQLQSFAINNLRSRMSTTCLSKFAHDLIRTAKGDSSTDNSQMNQRASFHYQLHHIIAMSPTPLEIKVKAVERLMKEKNIYYEEVANNSRVLNLMISSDADSYDIGKQKLILEESERMAVEIEAKISVYKTNLAKFLESYAGNENLEAAKELIKT